MGENILLSLTPTQVVWVTILLIWSLIWKGIALWKSARAEQKVWFVALLIINTVGLLEIFYIFVINRKKLQK